MLITEDLISIDKSNMYDVLKNFPSQVEEALNIAGSVKLNSSDTKGINNIIIAGMGGSAIGGDLIRSYTNYEIKYPVNIIRNYFLPKYASKETLVIISSYSGNTEETVSVYEEAISRGCKIICISSGGKVENLAYENKHILIKVPGGLQPRCAIGYSFFSLLVLFIRLGFINERENEIIRTVALLKEQSETYSAFKSDNNPALDIAKILQNHLPVIYSSVDLLDIVNLRWRGQFAENAKILSYGNFYPEMNHNELVGWECNRGIMEKIIVIMLRDGEDNYRILRRMDITKKTLEKYSAEVLDIYGSGKSKIERIFDLIYLGDWVSYYLAILNNVDPTPVEVIENLKKELEKEKG